MLNDSREQRAAKLNARLEGLERRYSGAYAPDSVVAEMDRIMLELAELSTGEPAECATCEEIKRTGEGPSHNGSPNCESGSIASGGTVAHCACDVCF